jgi:hypothetical protein
MWLIFGMRGLFSLFEGRKTAGSNFLREKRGKLREGIGELRQGFERASLNLQRDGQI